MYKNKDTHVDKKPLMQETWKESYCFYLESYKRIRTTERRPRKLSGNAYKRVAKAASLKKKTKKKTLHSRG